MHIPPDTLRRAPRATGSAAVQSKTWCMGWHQQASVLIRMHLRQYSVSNLLCKWQAQTPPPVYLSVQLNAVLNATVALKCCRMNENHVLLILARGRERWGLLFYLCILVGWFLWVLIVSAKRSLPSLVRPHTCLVCYLVCHWKARLSASATSQGFPPIKSTSTPQF